jgi:hypothetical protein
VTAWPGSSGRGREELVAIVGLPNDKQQSK